MLRSLAVPRRGELPGGDRGAPGQLQKISDRQTAPGPQHSQSRFSLNQSGSLALRPLKSPAGGGAGLFSLSPRPRGAGTASRGAGSRAEPGSPRLLVRLHGRAPAPGRVDPRLCHGSRTPAPGRASCRSGDRAGGYFRTSEEVFQRDHLPFTRARARRDRVPWASHRK